MSPLFAIFSRLLYVAMVTAIFSCGGGGGGSSTPTTGSLAVAVTGLPAGTGATVTVTGPGNFSQAVTASQTLSNLMPGTYTVTAANVLAATTVYSPQPTTQTVAVSAGATASASVVYSNAPALRLALQQVATGLSSPLFLTAPANDARLFIVERGGTIRIVKDGSLLLTPFLNISTRVSTDGERGLLSMAFHPQYATNGLFYVYFTDSSTGSIMVEQFRVSAANPDLADNSPLRIITIAHPMFSNHNGGLVAFGLDGFLYLGTGDGGSAGDPPGNAQNLNSLLGKLLRIDVSNASIMQPYTIPSSNPFFNQAGRRGEIWAYGLRNPWRYAFDAGASQLYIADVGQDRIEEVNVAPAGTGGLNYGWNITEGSLCYPGDPCNKQGQTLPVLEYAHDASGGCSVTGGFAYRGAAIPELQGRYLYSDFCNGWLRSFRYSNGIAAEQVDWNIMRVGNILSFGEDAQKELYMLATNNSVGTVYRIIKQ